MLWRGPSRPFIGYLTIFQSRLGLVNMVVDATTFSHQPERALLRRVRQLLEATIEVAVDETNDPVLKYLVEKKILSASLRKSGRYRGMTLTRVASGDWRATSQSGAELPSIPIYQPDIWMADPRVRSTIGVPTPENTDEVIELARQLRIIDASKNSWTNAGHLVSASRNATVVEGAEGNPFVLRAESPVLLRIILEQDGLLMRELVRFVAPMESVKRDEVADALPTLAQAALTVARELGVDARALSRGRKVVATLIGAKGSAGPGVREHRSSPRLEWLTDLGLLGKEGLSKNSFEYRVTDELRVVAMELEPVPTRGSDWPSIVALKARTVAQRDLPVVTTTPTGLATAYELIKRPIGPVPVRDVAFLTCLLKRESDFDATVQEIIELAQVTKGASLSGGRLSRAPENLYMSPESIGLLARE